MDRYASGVEMEHRVPVYEYKNPTRTWLHSSRRDWIVAKARQYAPAERTGRALDVGFGSGVYFPVLTELFGEVVGLDSQEFMVDHAESLTKQYSNLRIVADDITNCKLASGSFDLIVCSEVVEHIADSQKAIQEMHRMLKPKGILLLSTPQRWSILELMARIAYLPGVINFVKLLYPGQPLFDPGHINLMTEAEVTRQVEAAGFTIRERFKTGMYIPGVADLMGAAGLRFERWLEPKVRNSPASGILWEQYRVCEK
ncbi:MAG: class I SAM-dependent methyltransferase [Candidatus Binataceae bacterium]